jgi:uncharacterized protein (TIGR00290 family)
MHGVKEELIAAQAESIGIPLKKAYVYEGNNREYEQQMNAILRELQQEGIETVAFGDIFLEDLRAYREEKMRELGMQCLFPIWKKDTAWLVRDFIKQGFVTYTCCVNDGYLPESWVGRQLDEQFVAELPVSVDPCGENGEFHTFCVDGPIFKERINCRKGTITYRPLEIKASDHPTPVKDVGTKGFWFCDFYK